MVYATYGYIELQNQNYLVVVTKADFAANVAGRNTYLATEFKFIGLGFRSETDDQVSGG